MPKKLLERLSKLKPQQRIGLAVVAVIVAALLVVQLRPPERSVEAYCKVYKEESAKFPHEGGDKYEAGIFRSSSNNLHDFATAHGRLEQVAPDEIRYDVKALKAVLDKMDKDPSESFGAGLSGIGPQMRVQDWTKTHCQLNLLLR